MASWGNDSVEFDIPAESNNLLKEDEEKKLCAIVENGRTGEYTVHSGRRFFLYTPEANEARDELIVRNLKLVAKIAVSYRKKCRHIPLGDLIVEGTFGLHIAIDRFDLSMGTRLCTYATYWIRQQIGRMVKEEKYLIRIPSHLSEVTSKQIKGKPLSADQLRVVNNLYKGVYNPKSLYRRYADRYSYRNINDLLADKRFPMPDEIVLKEEMLSVLRNGIDRLPQNLRDVIRMRYFEGKSLKEVGEVFCRTRSRAQQMEDTALKLLHKHMQKRYDMEGTVSATRARRLYVTGVSRHSNPS
jgi:RNA polymerase primary sigma factor